MTLKELINSGVVGGSWFEIVDNETLEIIADVNDSNFASFRFLDEEVLNRKVAHVYSYCPEYIVGCTGKKFLNAGRDTVIVVEVD